MLFDPFEEQLDLPAKLVQSGNRSWREAKVVGQKEKPFLKFDIDIMNATQVFGIVDRTLRSGKANGLVAA
jgi:hypothetical protein